MRRSSVLLFASLTLICAAPAFSALADGSSGQTTTATTGGGTSATTPAKSTQPDPDQVICKREEVTGSRLGGPKECHTRRDWDQMATDARDSTSSFQQRSGQTSPLAGK
jgi:hypothetical protein